MKSVAFYSYKGGSGRTTACINFIYYFARKINASAEHPLILVDCDIDSCGLTYLLQTTQPVDEITKNKLAKLKNNNGLAQFFSLNRILCGDRDANINNSENDNMVSQEELVSEIRGTNRIITFSDGKLDISRNPFFTDMIPVGNFFGLENAYSVLFLPCDIKFKFSTFNQSINRENNFKTIMKMAKIYECSGVIYDCPAGTQELATWSLEASENIICCLRPTFQFRRGTADSIKNFIENYNSLLKKQIIICPNAVSNTSKIFYNNKFPEKIRDFLEVDVVSKVKQVVEELKNNNFDVFTIRDEMLYNSPSELICECRPENLRNIDLIGIPEVERFKWFEDCIGNIKCENNDEILAIERYKLLVSLIEKA